jgi:UMF1 family MFS transporter
MARLSPPDKLAQFFGFYAFSGKATSFIAPLMIGGLTAATGDPRLGVAVVLAFLYHGLILMPFVRVAK